MKLFFSASYDSSPAISTQPASMLYCHVLGLVHQKFTADTLGAAAHFYTLNDISIANEERFSACQ